MWADLPSPNLYAVSFLGINMSWWSGWEEENIPWFHHPSPPSPPQYQENMIEEEKELV